MVGTSKILTVSYGTFSCTLEGFDDSFNTMKAIAEYFRGLAADDRYFGAEPPTPDAEMLAKIAEREISRRVDARLDDSGIVLRASALADQSGDTQTDTAREAEQAAKADAEAEAKAARRAAKAAAKAERKAAKAAAIAQEKADAEVKAEADAMAKAEEEAKAREAAKAEAEAEAKARDTSEAEDAAKSVADEAKAAHELAQDAETKVENDGSEQDGPDDTSILESVGAATAADTEGTAGSDVEETRSDAPSSMLAAEDPVPETPAQDASLDDLPAPITEAPAHPDADSVAAKLQRIRAVVSQSDEDNSDTNGDLSSQFLAQSNQPVVADVVQENDPIAELDAHEAEIEAEDNLTPDDSSDVISRVAAANSAAVPAPEAAPKDVPAPRVIRLKRSQLQTASEEGTVSETIEAAVKAETGPDLGMLDGVDDLEDYLEDSDYADADITFDENDEDETTASPSEDVQAKREDNTPDSALTATDEEMGGQDGPSQTDTVAQGTDDQDAGNQDTGDQTAETLENTPSNAVMSDQFVFQKDIPDYTAAAEKAEENKASFLSKDPQVDDAALDRLMSETDAQMQEPEGSRRRDAIAQLKAAVAAKEAARQVGEPDDDGQDAENAFRNDLSQAVPAQSNTPVARPRPVARSENRTERPRPAPLKLVPAQRIDAARREDTTRTGPVVPRRVAARKEAQLPQAAGSFAEFAENMGASELPDLLEAAAAYTSFVEGADEFSRPQILRRVRAVAADEFNREDGLRSFAELLRSGRFTKVRNGRFQVADDSRFNPERRAG